MDIFVWERNVYYLGRNKKEFVNIGKGKHNKWLPNSNISNIAITFSLRWLKSYIDRKQGICSPENQVPLKLSPTNFRFKKSSNFMVSPKIPVFSVGVSHITLKKISPNTANMTRVAINIPFQLRSEPALATSSWKINIEIIRYGLFYQLWCMKILFKTS